MRTAGRSGMGYLDAERDRAGAIQRTGRCAVEAERIPAGPLRDICRCHSGKRRSIGCHIAGGEQCSVRLRCLRCAAKGRAARGTAGRRAKVVWLRDCCHHRESRTCDEAMHAAGCASQGRQHEHQNQRKSELCPTRHLLQCTVLLIRLRRSKPLPSASRQELGPTDRSRRIGVPGSFAHTGIHVRASQMAMVVQQLGDGKDEQPKPHHRGQEAQDKKGGDSLIPVAYTRMRCVRRLNRIIATAAVSCRADADSRANGRHQQQGDANDNPHIEHSDGLLGPKLPSLDAVPRHGTVN